MIQSWNEDQLARLLESWEELGLSARPSRADVMAAEEAAQNSKRNFKTKTLIGLLNEYWSKCGYEAGSELCWVWGGARRIGSKHDYGMAWFNKRHVRAHRLSYMLNVGSIPNGLCVLHECDNPPCSNPAHLFPGTKLDNAIDSYRKGRHFHNRRTAEVEKLLSNEEIWDIRARFRPHLKLDMAKEFGISADCLAGIVSRRTWNHI